MKHGLLTVSDLAEALVHATADGPTNGDGSLPDPYSQAVVDRGNGSARR